MCRATVVEQSSTLGLVLTRAANWRTCRVRHRPTRQIRLRTLQSSIGVALMLARGLEPVNWPWAVAPRVLAAVAVSGRWAALVVLMV